MTYHAHGGAYTQRLGDEMKRLLGTYYGTPTPEKIASYVGALRYKAVSADRVARAVDELIATHPKCPMPAQVISAALGTAGRSAAESESRARDLAQMRDAMARLSDYDAHAFRDAFGVWPDRSLYSRHNVTPPEGMTFRVLPRETCDAERQKAISACREAFYRLGDATSARSRAPTDRERREARLEKARAAQAAVYREPTATEAATGLRLLADDDLRPVAREPELEEDLDAHFDVAEDVDPGPEPGELAADLDDFDQDYGEARE